MQNLLIYSILLTSNLTFENRCFCSLKKLMKDILLCKTTNKWHIKIIYNSEKVNGKVRCNLRYIVSVQSTPRVMSPKFHFGSNLNLLSSN